MRSVAIGVIALLVLNGVGCGGTVIGEDPSRDASGDTALDGDVVDSHEHDALRDGVVILDSGSDDTLNDDVFIDPGCPDTPPPPPEFNCDPLAPPPGGCKAGQACFPYVEYPSSPCEHETYHAGCFPAGSGKEGDPCSSASCAAGYACVVSGAGNVCVLMCKPGKTGVCPEGLVCEPTDVPGVGGCL